ncbi:36628_t:CDS:2, partial [Gigaspora margarita]
FRILEVPTKDKAMANKFLNKRQVAFYKSKTSQKWDLAEFLETMELDKYKNTIFSVQVSSNHWSMFVLVEKDFFELD